METLGNYSEYMSMANDYASCSDGESLYYSINETIRKSTQDNDREDNITLSDIDATKIEDTTLQHEEMGSSGVIPNPNFMSSTPNNKHIDGFLEVSKMLRQISFKLHAVQNKENVGNNKNDLFELETIKTKKISSPKSTIIVRAPDNHNKPNSTIEVKKLKPVVPSITNQNRMSIRIGSQNVRKSFIPSRLEIKEKVKESPNKKVLPTKNHVRNDILRKSIIPKSAKKPVTSALKVATKPRSSILTSQKSLNIRRSIEKLNEAVNQKSINQDIPKPVNTISNKRKGNLCVAFNQKVATPEPKPSTSTSNKRYTLNPRRSIARFQVTANKEINTFECSKCKRKFRMESNYLSHMESHIDPKALNLVCKYCDKKFQLPGALNSHLQEHCTKIPSKEKRLLSSNGKFQRTPSSKTNSQTNSTDSLNKFSNCSANSGTTDPSLMKPPATSIITNNKKLRTLHSGVSRTPKKINMCKKCGKMFYNIFTLQAHKTCAESDDETDDNVQN